MNCIFSVLSQESEEWKLISSKIKQWLTGTGKLSFSDDSEYYYKVKQVKILKNTREMNNYSKLEVNFVCAPHKYVRSGLFPQTLDNVVMNPYDDSRPIYIIQGNGNCTLLVNGNKMTANIGGNLRIDTDLLIAYREDGTLMSTSVNGDYEKLYLRNGENTIQITNGFSLSVIPNWKEGVII